MSRFAMLGAILGLIGSSVGAQDKKTGATIGLTPLNEMTATDRYKGEDGGLYGQGRNKPLPDLQRAADAELAKIALLDADGQPSVDGIIGFVSISMSNATQEFRVFKRQADADPAKSPRVTIVDCAQGGQAMAQWVDPRARPWQEADRRLRAANVSPKQVQAAWIKLANIGPRGELEQHGRKLQKDAQAVIKNAKERFPNLRAVYLGSRIYAGLAVGGLNPEPYAYESAFAVRWLIQDQMKGETKFAVLLWGPYFWADGEKPRKSDGLIWKKADFAADGVHPSPSGCDKVAHMLLDFFKTDPLAKGWFLANTSQ